MSYTKGYRYNQAPADGGVSAQYVREIQNPAYATTLNIVANDPNAEKLIIDVQKLTGAMTVTADTATPFAGDTMSMTFGADGTNRVVTFSTGFVTAGTVTCLANKNAVVEFIFSSFANAWVEKGRFVQS